MSPGTVDPYRPDHAVFECRMCHYRVVSSKYVGSCPNCGGPTENIAVARE